MLTRGKAQRPEALLSPVASRNPACWYFLRVAGWSPQLEEVLWQCHEAARKRGVVLGEIPNPDMTQLTYYREQLGSDFELSGTFITAALQKWLPGLRPDTRRRLADAMTQLLHQEKQRGKSDSALRGLFTKLMCWLYYRFRGITDQLGGDRLPLIFCLCAELSSHALALLQMLGGLGADILLVEPQGDEWYQLIDPNSAFSEKCEVPGLQPFPKDFTLKSFQKKHASAPPPPKPPAPKPAVNPGPRPVPPQVPPVRPAATPPVVRPAMPPVDPLQRFTPPSANVQPNVWMKNAELESILTPVAHRGGTEAYHTVLMRLRGVRDKLTYPNELYQFYRKLSATGRRVAVVDGAFPEPSPEELRQIRRRGRYLSVGEMAVDLAGNLPTGASQELTRLAQRAFAEVLLEAEKAGEPMTRLMTNAVILLCWVRRYHASLYSGWKPTEMPCLIRMGHCEHAREELFLSWLSRMPVDLLLLAPNLNQIDSFQHPALLELTGEESLPEFAFPRDASSLQMRTLASHAQEELTGMLFEDSGLYRDRQFSRANAVVLQSTQDEVDIYWDQELRFRPNFAAEGGEVTLPVLWARMSGVPDGEPLRYWQHIKSLTMAPDTLLFQQMPMIPASQARQHTALATKYLRDGRIRADGLISDKQYPYGPLRREVQAHMLLKVQEMLDQRLILGTFENGTEYTVLSTALSLPAAVSRMIQSFDFTKKNPKIVCIHTAEREGTLEDAIFLTFLSLVGFDVVLFVPTGYQTIERFLRERLPVDHQLGAYRFDLHVPDFSTLPNPKNGFLAEGLSWVGNLFKRGN